jgi:hypothetical protein
MICEQTSKGDAKVNECDPVSLVFNFLIGRHRLIFFLRKLLRTDVSAVTASSPTSPNTRSLCLSTSARNGETSVLRIARAAPLVLPPAERTTLVVPATLRSTTPHQQLPTAVLLLRPQLVPLMTPTQSIPAPLEARMTTLSRPNQQRPTVLLSSTLVEHGA